MIRRAALAGVVLSTLTIGVAYASAFLPGGAPGWAAWAMAVGTAALMVATMALGAARDGRLGKLRFPFALVFLLLVAGFGAMLALPAADPADPTLWLGLPPRAAVVLYGIGILPLLVVPVAYALTFDEMTLSEADLARVREQAARCPSSAVRQEADSGRRTTDRREGSGAVVEEVAP